MSVISFWNLWVGEGCQYKGCDKLADNYCDCGIFDEDDIEDECCKLLCEDHSKKMDMGQHYCFEHYKQNKI